MKYFKNGIWRLSLFFQNLLFNINTVIIHYLNVIWLREDRVGNIYHLFMNRAAAAVSWAYAMSKSNSGLLNQRFVFISEVALLILIALKMNQELAAFSYFYFLLSLPWWYGRSLLMLHLHAIWSGVRGLAGISLLVFHLHFPSAFIFIDVGLGDFTHSDQC